MNGLLTLFMTSAQNPLLLLDARRKETSIWLAQYEGSIYDVRAQSVITTKRSSKVNLYLVSATGLAPNELSQKLYSPRLPVVIIYFTS